MSTLGVIILSLQGMKYLPQCVESIRWADEVVVLHIGDEEPAIGVGLSPSVVVKRLASAPEVTRLFHEIGTDWVLLLWGEERIEDGLSEEMRALCGRDLTKAPLSCRIPIRSYILGRWVEGSLWGPTPALRLSREVRDFALGWWDRLPKASMGSTEVLSGWIGDYSSVGLSDGVERLDSISTFWAERLGEKGLSPGPVEMVLEPLRTFMRLLWMNGIFSSGAAGLTLSTLAAYATLLSGAKLWEARNVKPMGKQR